MAGIDNDAKLELQEIIRECFQNVRPSEFDAGLEAINEIKSVVESLELQLKSVAERVDDLALGQKSFLRELVTAGPFLDRLNQDVTEKERIAELVLEEFFSERHHHFVQASTTTYKLGQLLAKSQEVAKGSLVHTNSAVMHLPMLHGYGQFTARCSVWPFCGKKFDPTCAAYLIPETDQDSAAALENLIDHGEHGNDPVTHAYLIPRFATPHAMCYEQPESASMAKTLCRASLIVVLLPGERFFENREKIETLHSYYCADNGLFEDPQRVKFVVSNLKQPEPPEWVRGLKIRGFTVYWDDGKDWKQLK